MPNEDKDSGGQGHVRNDEPSAAEYWGDILDPINGNSNRLSELTEADLAFAASFHGLVNIDDIDVGASAATGDIVLFGAALSQDGNISGNVEEEYKGGWRQMVERGVVDPSYRELL